MANEVDDGPDHTQPKYRKREELIQRIGATMIGESLGSLFGHDVS
jgi:hypothetical protein